MDLDPDLDQARRRARELLARARAGDAAALVRLRPDRPPLLADAQRAVAVELGFASWPALTAFVAERPDRDDEIVTSRWSYRRGSPVLVHVRHRPGRVDVDDLGAAVDLAGRPPGWRDAAERAVDALCWNINRRGVVFMQAVPRRPIAPVIDRTAEVSVSVYLAVLALDDGHP